MKLDELGRRAANEQLRDSGNSRKRAGLTKTPSPLPPCCVYALGRVKNANTNRNRVIERARAGFPVLELH